MFTFSIYSQILDPYCLVCPSHFRAIGGNRCLSGRQHNWHRSLREWLLNWAGARLLQHRNESDQLHNVLARSGSYCNGPSLSDLHAHLHYGRLPPEIQVQAADGQGQRHGWGLLAAQFFVCPEQLECRWHCSHSEYLIR